MCKGILEFIYVPKFAKRILLVLSIELKNQERLCRRKTQIYFQQIKMLIMILHSAMLIYYNMITTLKKKLGSHIKIYFSNVFGVCISIEYKS